MARRAGSGIAGEGFVEPMMPTLVEKPPEGPDWLHEIKYDGYRTQIVIAGKTGRAFTRRGLDWTKKYQRIVDAARELGRDCHLEGEIIVQDAAGRPDFNALRSDIERGAGGRLILYAFDLLSLDGEDLRARACEARRALLSDLLGSPAASFPIHFSEAHSGPGQAFFSAIERMNLEGMVSKKRNSPYRSGYTKAWLKVKTFLESEFVVVGYDTTPGGVRSLLVAREVNGQLSYAGRVMVTLRGPKREAIWMQLEEHRTDRPPLPELQHGPEVEWFTPGVHVPVRHLRGEETLRHATLLGLSRAWSSH